jgi:hypothetical protein
VHLTDDVDEAVAIILAATRSWQADQAPADAETDAEVGELR